MSSICACNQTLIQLTNLTDISEEYIAVPHGGWRRSALFYGRLHNRRIAVAASCIRTAHGGIYPAVFDGDMARFHTHSCTVSIEIFNQAGSGLRARRMLLCTAAASLTCRAAPAIWAVRFSAACPFLGRAARWPVLDEQRRPSLSGVACAHLSHLGLWPASTEGSNAACSTTVV